jgi:hypothetical protein
MPVKSMREDYREEIEKLAKTMTFTDIAMNLGIKLPTLYHWTTKWGLKSTYTDKKFKDPTEIQKQLLIASLLGDGSIGSIRGTKSFRVQHCLKQKEYLYWKYDILQDLTHRQPTIRKSSNPRKQGLTTEAVGFSMATNVYTDYLYGKNYSNGNKILPDYLADVINPFILAVWYMDDGTLGGNRNCRLYTNNYTKYENEHIQNILSKKFNLVSSIQIIHDKEYHKDYCSIIINVKSSHRMCKLISPYILPCMEYKLIH